MSAPDYFDGSPDEIRAYLETILGTHAFRLIGEGIELELPEIGKDGRPQSSGSTRRVLFRAPSDWTVAQPGSGGSSHAVPAGRPSTLCGIATSSWQKVVNEGHDSAVTCPWCRVRLVAIEVAAPPAGVAARWTTQCVYTMRHSRDLESAIASEGTAEWRENRAWKQARRLLDGRGEAEAVPIIFSAADRDSGLIFYGRLDDVVAGEDRTSYSVSGLRPLSTPRPLSALTVVSSGAPLPDTYIRPYAICFTPAFLRQPDEDRPVAAEREAHERVKLHDEIARILRRHNNRWMTTRELADLVNEAGRYKKRDDSAITSLNIHGRTRNYPRVFERDGTRVRLRGR